MKMELTAEEVNFYGFVSRTPKLLAPLGLPVKLKEIPGGL